MSLSIANGMNRSTTKLQQSLIDKSYICSSTITCPAVAGAVTTTMGIHGGETNISMLINGFAAGDT